MGITKNKNRVGSFSGSEIIALTTTGKGELGFGEKAITYIAEKNLERIMGISIDTEAEAFPLIWGKAMEERIFNMPDFDPNAEYNLTSDITITHPFIDFWVGSPDGFREIPERTVFDFKAPSSKKSFALLALPTSSGLVGIEAMNALRNGFIYKGVNIPKHKDGEKFYWQLVNNAIVSECDWAELIVYMPYDSELLDIKNSFGDDPRYKWIVNKSEISSIPDNGFLKNINIIRFKVPKEDKDALSVCVLKAGKLLIKRSEVSADEQVFNHDQAT